MAMGSRLQDHPEGAGTTRGQMSLVLGWLGPPLAPSLRFQVELPRSLLVLMRVVSPPPTPEKLLLPALPRSPVLRACSVPIPPHRSPVQAWVESLRHHDDERQGLTDLHPDVFAVRPRWGWGTRLGGALGDVGVPGLGSPC